jgi:CheY-like chemotaxis protein
MGKQVDTEFGAKEPIGHAEYKQILLVEDEPAAEMMVRRALKRMGKSEWLVWKKNGEEALEYLEGCENPPCVILLDIQMPVMDGLEFFKRAKENDLLIDFKDGKKSEIPVVILTTVDAQDSKERAKELGALHYFQKGATMEEYIEQLKVISTYWNMVN